MTGSQVPAGLPNLAEPLRAAAEAGREDMVAELLDRGADPAPRRSESALHAAAVGGHEAALRLLLQRGASLEALSVWEDGLPVSPLHVTAYHGHAALAAACLRLGAEPEPRTENGDTPMHFAATAGAAD